MAKPTLSKWISALSDDTYLLDLTIPGTHDSGSKYVEIGKQAYAKTQDKTIKEQLELGIRFLDIRLKREKNTQFKVVHGTPEWRGIKQADCNLGFNYIIDSHIPVKEACETFLADNPNEFIIMSIKDENGDNNQQFDAALRSAIGPITEEGFWYTKEYLPKTLADARGKIIILRRWFGFIHAPYGIDASPIVWPDEHSNPFIVNNFICVQDDWDAPSNLEEAITKKWRFVKAQLDFASTAMGREYLFLNFASANGTEGLSKSASPQNIAEGKGETKGILECIREYYSASSVQLSYGIVALDFAGSSKAGDLTQRLVDRNFKMQWPYGTKINSIDVTWRGLASCFLNDTIYLFWRATSKKGEMFVTTSTNGVTWPQGTSPSPGFSSPENYSCCVFNGVIHLVWMGADNPAYIYHAVTDGRNWAVSANPIVLADENSPPQIFPTVSRAPSICATLDKLYISYADAASAIHVIESTDGNVWRYNANLTPYSTVGPSCCAFKGKPFVFYSLFPTNQIYYSCHVSGRDWNFVRGNDLNQSPSAVAACEYKGALWIFFQSNDGKNSIQFSYTDEINFVDPTTIGTNDYTDHMPAAVAVSNQTLGDKIFLMWKANDWGNWIYQSSATLDDTM